MTDKWPTFPFLTAVAALGVLGAGCTTDITNPVPQASAQPCANDAGITLPPGFCASVFADNIGHARHLAVSQEGVVYANTWSGRYFGNDTPHAGGFLVAMQDTQGTGHADVIRRFGDSVETGGHGGTGIAIYDHHLYAEANDRIVRYAFEAGSIDPKGPAETVVTGLPLDGDHPMHPFIIDPDGRLYVDVPSASNSCQATNRTLRSPGMTPCAELQVRAGIWRYDARKLGQVHNPAARFATGIRNADGLAFDETGRGLYATQHGRDQLGTNWSNLYTPEQGATLPAEELLRVTQGTDAGWPMCYFDPVRGRLVQAPEYGGDGGHLVGDCATKQAPVAAFPAHWAPNDLLLYFGRQFPAHYHGGAFIAFHGSWNRAPFAQDGFNIVFQPLAQGTAATRCELFAEGFAGAAKDRGKAEHRPTGLALGPDGALYIADDVKGRIYRVTYRGGTGGAAPVGAPCPAVDASPGPMLADDVTPQPDNATRAAAAAPPAVPPSATLAMVMAGDRLYHSGACAGCHGLDGSGTALGPTLRSGTYTWIDGSPAAIGKIIASGVPEPKNFRNPMPPLGGSALSAEELANVSAYVWSLGHTNAR
jgi:glucose/arabinose dehydrogenase/mono/diheme cytochrome c family protein